jgi:4-coumarate--CoA ligase
LLEIGQPLSLLVGVGPVSPIVDRVKELIEYKGPQVADRAVIGVPGEEAGEVRKAFVVPAKVRQGESGPVAVADVQRRILEPAVLSSG